MPRKPFDPLARIPKPDLIRTKLSETETLARRLKVLLDLSEKLHDAPNGTDTHESVQRSDPPGPAEGGS